MEAPRDLLVDRVHLHRHVGVGHHRHRIFDGSAASTGHVSSLMPMSLAATARRRPGSWSAPTRSRTAFRNSPCPTWSGWSSRRPSMPLVMVSRPCRCRVLFQPSPGLDAGASGSGPTAPHRHCRGTCRRCGRRRSARRSPRRSWPCARRSRGRRGGGVGSGLPSGPSGLT
jgi:hypothetical protein